MAYATADVDVPPPTKAQLEAFERSLIARSDVARAEVERCPPKALPRVEACGRCPVRHLCDEYWQFAAVKSDHPMASSTDDTYEDVELELVEPQGPAMWSAFVLVSSSLERGHSVRLQVGPEQVALPRRGRHLRLLGVRVVELEDAADASVALIAPSAWTEYFVHEA